MSKGNCKESICSNDPANDNLDSESRRAQVFLPSPSLIAGGINLTINTSRKQRKITYDPVQTYITDYFKVLDEIETLVKENEKLSNLLKQCVSNKYINTGSHGLTPVLRQILINAKKNVYRYPTQWRHS